MDVRSAAKLFSPKNSAYETTEFTNLFQLLGTNETRQEVALVFEPNACMTTRLANAQCDVDNANT